MKRMRYERHNNENKNDNYEITSLNKTYHEI